MKSFVVLAEKVRISPSKFWGLLLGTAAS